MPPEPSQRPDRNRLFEMAATQAGLFTTGQAAEAGYSTSILGYYVKTGRFVRRLPGIYRLAHFPAGEHEAQILGWLWSEREGVLSRETALRLHEPLGE